jgi:carbonic anhydrase
VVFLVAVPLSLGIALASGAPVTAGLIAAAVGGIVAGVLGGSPLQVSGPAAGLTVVVATLIDEYGWATMCVITALAGLLQIGLGLSKVARAALAVSPAVVHGMLAGIGVSIVLAQLHVVLGGSPVASPVENLISLPREIAAIHWEADAIGLLTIIVLLAWPRLPGAFRKVPAALPAIVIATVVAIVLGMDHLDRPEVPDDILGTLGLPGMPSGELTGIALGVITVALVASLESLLSAVAVDKLHDGPRSDVDRELIGQGSANIASGLLGGLPVTGVIVRSSTNVKAGARTRASAVLHGVWIVVFVIFFGGLIEQIPLASLAALLVVVGVRLLDLSHVRELRRHRDLPAYLATAIGVLVTDLLEGVLIGLAVTLLLAMYRLTHTRVEVAQVDDDTWQVRVSGSLTFLSAPKLIAALRQVPDKAVVDLELDMEFLDHTAFDTLDTWRTTHERLGGTVRIDEPHSNWYSSRDTATPVVNKGSDSEPAMLASAWFAPWPEFDGRAQDADAEEEDARPSAGAKLHRGISEYQQRSASLVEPYLADLARDGQHPTHLFIGCADSRLVPNLITNSGPGDLFTVRNIGNLVPPHRDDTRSDDSSVAAAIEYAVGTLEVRAITVCGHSSCGAMGALVGGRADTLPVAVGRWLDCGEVTVDRNVVATSDDTGLSPADQLAQSNVLQQLGHLMTYPSVRDAVAAGTLRLSGMYFDIAAAQVHLLDPTIGRFVRPAEVSPETWEQSETQEQQGAPVESIRRG